MITKNYRNTARNSRVDRVYTSIKTQLSQGSCPNCWGTQEYNDQKIDGKEFKAPKKTHGPITLIQQFANTFITNIQSRSHCNIC